MISWLFDWQEWLHTGFVAALSISLWELLKRRDSDRT